MLMLRIWGNWRHVEDLSLFGIVIVTLLMFCTVSSSSGQVSERTEKITLDSVIAGVREGLDGSSISFSIEVHGGGMDEGKAVIAEGMAEGFSLTEDARAVLKNAIHSYPFRKVDGENYKFEGEFCDFIGYIAIYPENAAHYFMINLGLYDFVEIEIIRRGKDGAESVVLGSWSGVWVDSELTVYRVCELMQESIKK